MTNLERAIAIAVEAHAGQVDKAGEPYILHVLRVMLAVETTEERVVAVLHDVVEDTDWTIGRLREEGFPERVLGAIQSVTKQDGETYQEFVSRAATDPIGRAAKIADLLDNSDLSRIPHPTDADRARLARYRDALTLLGVKVD